MQLVDDSIAPKEEIGVNGTCSGWCCLTFTCGQRMVRMRARRPCVDVMHSPWCSLWWERMIMQVINCLNVVSSVMS